MKILFFTENYYKGGLDTFLVTLINAWPHLDDELALICNRSHPGLDDIRRRLVRPCRIVAHSMPGQSRWYRGQSDHPILSNRVFATALSLVRKACAYPLFLFYLLALILRFRSTRYDRLMVVNGGYPGGMTCRAASIAWSTAGLRPLSVHNVHNFATLAPRSHRWLQNGIDVLVARSSAALVSVSDACLDSLNLRQGLRNHGRRMVIPNGIASASPSDRGSREVRAELGIPADAPLCLMLGTYEPRKGHGFFLKSFRQVVTEFPQARALICGYGSAAEIRCVEETVRALGLQEHVVLQGHRSDIHDLLAAAQILVMPSQVSESFGLVIVEAMAMQRAVVATRVGGLPEVMPDGAGGLLVDADDEAGFARAMAMLLADPQRAYRLGQIGLQRYRSTFTAEIMASQYATLLHASNALAEAPVSRGGAMHSPRQLR